MLKIEIGGRTIASDNYENPSQDKGDNYPERDIY